MSILSRAKAKVKVARDSYAEFQVKAQTKKAERATREREEEEQRQNELVTEAKRLNELAERREKTNQLKRDVESAKQRKFTAECALKEEKRKKKLAEVERKRKDKQAMAKPTSNGKPEHKPAKVTWGVTIGKPKPATKRKALPRRKPVRITPKRPKLRR